MELLVKDIFISDRNPEPEMTPEERDARTVFCMQLSARIRPRDLEEFFSSVGKVRQLVFMQSSAALVSCAPSAIPIYVLHIHS